MLSMVLCLISMSAIAQVSATFENRKGYTYAVLTNDGSYTVTVVWRCINYQLGQWRDGSINLQPGYETCVGPNVGWTWQPGEEFIYQVVGGTSQRNISFKGAHGDATPPNSQKDGYIYQGRSVKVNGKSYRLYKKDGHQYIYDRLDGWCRIN